MSRPMKLAKGVGYKCVFCNETKKIEELHEANIPLKNGVCNKCHRSLAVKARREQRIAKSLEDNIQRSRETLIDAVKTIQKKFADDRFPLEAQIMYNILDGALKTLKEINSAVLFSANIKGQNATTPLQDFERGVIFPIIMYTFKKLEGNQIATSNTLGISRNTLRTKLKEIAIYSPRLIDEYECWAYMPKKNSSKESQYAIEYLREVGAIPGEDYGRIIDDNDSEGE